MNRRLRYALWGALFGACATPPPASPHVEADAILVLGHRPALTHGVIDREIRARVEGGIALYRLGRAPLLVLSGGESTPGVIESDVMAAFAEKAGVPSNAIVRERASTNTIENARFSLALLRQRIPDRAPRVVLVTSDYHSERAGELVACAGGVVELAPVVPPLSYKERRQRQRSEQFVRLYYRFIDECQRALGR